MDNIKIENSSQVNREKTEDKKLVAKINSFESNKPKVQEALNDYEKGVVDLVQKYYL